MIIALSHLTSGFNLTAMPWLFCQCFARYLLHGYCWTLIPFLSDLPFLSPTSNKSTPPPSKTLSNSSWCSCCFRLTCSSPPSLLLSMHGIQIISRASLCCCMEGMGVFELDLLDNIRSTQISFHAMLFHADRVAHTGMLIRFLFLRKFERES